jgi:hypothetical protein
MNNTQATKHKFYYGEETYTICVTKDDWWIEEVGYVGQNDGGRGRVALENGMLPPKGKCADCYKGTYEDIVEDYHIGGIIIKHLICIDVIGVDTQLCLGLLLRSR